MSTPRKVGVGSERIDENDILSAAREKHGLERLDHIEFAVIEATGDLTIIPKT
jgi:uncharacterized membrane protein YcaP (DUF421 family)